VTRRASFGEVMYWLLVSDYCLLELAISVFCKVFKELKCPNVQVQRKVPNAIFFLCTIASIPHNACVFFRALTKAIV